MTSRAVYLIIGLTFLTFFNTLFSDFTGDAYGLFAVNDFYAEPRNALKVFSPQLILTPETMASGFFSHPTDFSGFVSYRPVTALSFFFDYGTWGKNPFGHHLTNLILHILTVLLVYALALTVTKTTAVAFWAAMLFGVHPVQAEVINSIGYRSDSLVVLFYLSAMLAYRQYHIQKESRGIFLFLSLFSFFLALFSKESALTLPLMLALYDYWFLAAEPLRTFLKKRWKTYLAYAAVYIFYLWIYFGVMSNVYYSQYRLIGHNLIDQGKIILEILFHYLSALFLPWQTTVLPPLYAPAAEAVPLWHMLAVVLFVLAAIVAAFRQLPVNRIYPFGAVWFFVTYLPTANILSLINPFGFRFLYLPSIGFFIAAAWGLDRLLKWLKPQMPSVNLENFVKIAILGVCVSVTVPLNFFFKNNFVTCLEMIRNYPESSRPYWLLATMYFDRREYEKTREYLQAYLDREPNLSFLSNPKQDYVVYHLMGRSYPDDPDRAIEMFYKVIQLNPTFALVYADLAKAYILKDDFADAVNAGLKAVTFQPDLVMAYVYVTHSYWAMGDAAAAKEWLNKGLEVGPNDENLRYLQGVIK